MTSKPHRLSSCHRHPTRTITGFCASCLRERLSGIESSSSAATHDYPAQPTAELRRTKSCSGGGGDGPSTSVPERRRRSCEGRAPSTLWDLFSLDDEKKGLNRKFNVDLRSLDFEIREEEHGDGDEGIKVCGNGFVCDGEGIADGRGEVDEESKTMKEFIDLELRNRRNTGRDFRDIAGSFWEAASIFSKKLRKWRRKQKLKKLNGGGRGGNVGVGLMGVEVEKPGMRRLRETQSEVGEYGLGRRSCDTDPRSSIDVGRMSVDDSQISFDAPRASWDGYLIGKACSRLSPMAMVSVKEDAKVPVNGTDNRVLVEDKVNLESAEEPSPGGSAQTNNYYSASLSWQRRRRSFDRSNSHRKPAMAEVDDLKVISNAKVSPATTELFYGAKVLITEKDLRDTNLKSLNNGQSDCVLGSASDSKDASDVATGVNQKGSNKFCKWRKVWTKLGLVQRRKDDKLGEEECATGDMVNKPLAESWQKLRRAVNGKASESVSQKLIRSYSVSCRNPWRMAGHETKGNVWNGRQDFMLQRNRSVRYWPNNLDAGLLRFYLTPLNSYRRSKSAKSNLKDLHPTTRSVS